MTEVSSISAEAADWLQRLEDDAPETRAAFYDWVRQSPHHYEEFLRMSEILFQLKSSSALDRLDVTKLLRQSGGNVFSLNDAAPIANAERPHVNTTRKRGAWWTIAAAVSAVAIVLTAIWSNDSKTYVTSRGEQRTIKLADGSVVYLNAESRLISNLSSEKRALRLESGEALFSVARDVKRPFEVQAGDTRVRAIGTEFNISRYRHGETTVAVLEGVVEIASNAGNAVVKSAGETVQVNTTGSISKSSGVNARDKVAWRKRQLIFRDTPLAEVAEEFNRYNGQSLRIEGAELQEKKLSGTFSADRPEGLLLFLERDPEVQIERGERQIVVSERKTQ